MRRVALHMLRGLPARVELSDLTQAGFVGLLDAAAKYDQSKGVRFWTYAELRIRGSILDSLRTLDWVPRSVRRRRRELHAATSRLETKLGRPPSDLELSRELGVSVKELREVVVEVRRAEASAEMVEGLEDLDTFVRDDRAVDPHRALERREMMALLTRGIEDLPDRERLVVTLYYHEELTMKEVGEVLGVNESRISQIHSSAVKKLRMRLRRHLHPVRSSLIAHPA